jgi:hypothetical protein
MAGVIDVMCTLDTDERDEEERDERELLMQVHALFAHMGVKPSMQRTLFGPQDGAEDVDIEEFEWFMHGSAK